ncbi:MAG: hypothetical protein FWH17_03900 [Oscillospiraceae bacterium]|nr:hypothetical protein [Oscillospiraceae bacterium]
MKKRRFVSITILFVFCLNALYLSSFAADEEITVTSLMATRDNEDIRQLGESMDRLTRDAKGYFSKYSELITSDIPIEAFQKISLSEPIHVYSATRKRTTEEDNFLSLIANRNSTVHFIVYADDFPIGLVGANKQGARYVITSVIGDLYAIAYDEAMSSLGGGELICIAYSGGYFLANAHDEVIFVTASPDHDYPPTTLTALGNAADKNGRELLAMYPDGNVPPGGTYWLEFLFEGKQESFPPHISQAPSNVMLYLIIIISVLFTGSMICVYIVSENKQKRLINEQAESE